MLEPSVCGGDAAFSSSYFDHLLLCQTNILRIYGCVSSSATFDEMLLSIMHDWSCQPFNFWPYFNAQRSQCVEWMVCNVYGHWCRAVKTVRRGVVSSSVCSVNWRLVPGLPSASHLACGTARSSRSASLVLLLGLVFTACKSGSVFSAVCDFWFKAKWPLFS